MDNQEDTDGLFELPDESLVQELFSELELIQQIGEGGEGIVYLVRELKSGLELSLKLLVKQTPMAKSQFEKEGRIICELDHEYIVKGYDYGKRGDFLFILMEYCSGGSLLQKIWDNKLSDLEAATIVARVGKGLHHAHIHGVLHRDIKPENVMVTEKGKPVLVDFGLAYCAGEDVSLLEAIGSPGYAAPEIWGHPEKVSVQTDIYALGALLYTVLTQKLPDPHNVNYNFLFDRDKAFILLIVKSMDKDAGRRYSNVGEFVNEIIKIGKNVNKPPGIW